MDRGGFFSCLIIIIIIFFGIFGIATGLRNKTAARNCIACMHYDGLYALSGFSFLSILWLWRCLKREGAVADGTSRAVLQVLREQGRMVLLLLIAVFFMLSVNHRHRYRAGIMTDKGIDRIDSGWCRGMRGGGA